MKNIILSVAEIITTGYEKNLNNLLNEGQDISQFILKTREDLDKVGCLLTQEALETLDEAVRETPQRKSEWYIHERDKPNTLACIFGEVHYTRTYYKNKEDAQHCCLSDKLVGIAAYDKMDLSLKARCVEGALTVSYRQSGRQSCEALEVTGQTVMNALKWLGPVPLHEECEGIEKREVECLFIEADEDHVAMRNGRTGEPKLVYVHEGVERVGKSRFALKNPMYFSGMFRESEELWVTIEDYIDMRYSREKIKKIYLSGDRGNWIRNGAGWIKDAIYVVDKYHLSKYITSAAGHIQNGCKAIWDAINRQDKEYLEIVLETIQDHPDSERRDLSKAFRYIRASFKTTSHYSDKSYRGCSAEGHVSHILSDRLSSRPRVWSEEGIDRMARLRVEVANGGEIYPLMLKTKQERMLEEKTIQFNKKIIEKRKIASGDELVHNLPYINRGQIGDSLRMMKSFRGL